MPNYACRYWLYHTKTIYWKILVNWDKHWSKLVSFKIIKFSNIQLFRYNFINYFPATAIDEAAPFSPPTMKCSKISTQRNSSLYYDLVGPHRSTLTSLHLIGCRLPIPPSLRAPPTLTAPPQISLLFRT